MAPRCWKCSNGWHGWQHERYVYAAAPEYREQMIREHYPYDCGRALVREGGRWYPSSTSPC